jgi:hypothetical protein
VPEVDNLYLDMNGIIHNCTHGNDPGTKLTETQMIVKVFNYLEKLFQIVQPQKLLFMAIDGARARAVYAASCQQWQDVISSTTEELTHCGAHASARGGAAREDEPAAFAPLQGSEGAAGGAGSMPCMPPA